MRFYLAMRIHWFLLYLPVLIQAQELLVPDGHIAPLTRIVLTPDEKYFVTLSTDETARLWDLATGAFIRIYDDASGSICITPNGKFLVTGSPYIFKPDSTIRVRRIDNGQIVRQIKGQNVIGLSEDGLKMLFYDCIGRKMAIKLSGLLVGQPIVLFTIDSATALAVSKDLSLLAAGFENGEIAIYETKTGNLKAVFHEHAEEITKLNFTDDQKYLISGGGDRFIKIFDLNNGSVRSVWANFNKALAIDPQQQYVLSSSFDNTLEMFDFKDGNWIRLIDHNAYSIADIALTQNGELLIEACTDKKVKIINLKTQEVVQEIGAQSLFVSHLAVSGDDRYLIASSYDNLIRVWDLKTGELSKTIPSQGVMQTYLNDSLDLITSISAGPSAEIKKFSTGEEIKMFANHEFLCFAIAFDARQTRVATGGYDRKIHVWSFPESRFEQTFLGHSGNIMALCFSKDGRYLASSAFDKTLRVWDLETGKAKYVFNNGLINQMILKNDSLLFGAGQDGAISVWNFSDGTLLRKIKAHDRPIASIALYGNVLASASEDHTIRLWNCENGKLLQTLEGHTAMLNYVVFTHDGKRLISAAHDGAIKIWDVATGKLIATMIGFRNGEWITCAENGNYVASKNGDAYVHWRVDNEVFSLKQFSEIHKNRESVANILQSTVYNESKFQFSLPPHVEIIRPYSQPSINQGELKLEIAAKGRNEDLIFEVYLNDALVLTKKELKVSELITHMNVKLIAGNNRITVIAQNGRGIKSSESKMYVYYNGW
ncbi:WD40 repeat domain-containing protein [bacterium]|nr:WD40 repeat domain-containing protein [bacterium]